MRLILISLLAAILTGLMAVVTSNYFTFSNPASAFSAVVAERNVSIQRGIAYGEHERHRLDIYRPVDGEAKALVLFLYGGGWKSGKRSTYGFVGAALASRGYVTVIPDYRLYPEAGFRMFMNDAARAYAHTAREIAGDLPIILMGHSAGAHMAALLAYDRHYLAEAATGLARPAGFIGLAGPYAFDPTTWPSTKNIFADVKVPDHARPVTFVTPEAPPALVMHGLDDGVVKLWNMQKLAAALDAAGVPVRQRELEGMGHIRIILALARPFRWRNDVLEDVIAFAERVRR